MSAKAQPLGKRDRLKSENLERRIERIILAGNEKTRPGLTPVQLVRYAKFMNETYEIVIFTTNKMM